MDQHGDGQDVVNVIDDVIKPIVVVDREGRACSQVVQPPRSDFLPVCPTDVVVFFVFVVVVVVLCQRLWQRDEQVSFLVGLQAERGQPARLRKRLFYVTAQFHVNASVIRRPVLVGFLHRWVADVVVFFIRASTDCHQSHECEREPSVTVVQPEVGLVESRRLAVVVQQELTSVVIVIAIVVSVGLHCQHLSLIHI